MIELSATIFTLLSAMEKELNSYGIVSSWPLRAARHAHMQHGVCVNIAGVNIIFYQVPNRKWTVRCYHKYGSVLYRVEDYIFVVPYVTGQPQRSNYMNVGSRAPARWIESAV